MNQSGGGRPSADEPRRLTSEQLRKELEAVIDRISSVTADDASRHPVRVKERIWHDDGTGCLYEPSDSETDEATSEPYPPDKDIGAEEPDECWY